MRRPSRDEEQKGTGADTNDGRIIEVRTYRARAGQRERLMSLMRELAFPVQRKLGMRVLGPFPSSEDSVTFVWLRGFPNRESREPMKRAFYEGREWTEELEEKLMPLLEEYNAIAVEDDDGLWDRWPSPAQ